MPFGLRSCFDKVEVKEGMRFVVEKTDVRGVM